MLLIMIGLLLNTAASNTKWFLSSIQKTTKVGYKTRGMTLSFCIQDIPICSATGYFDKVFLSKETSLG